MSKKKWLKKSVKIAYVLLGAFSIFLASLVLLSYLIVPKIGKSEKLKQWFIESTGISASVEEVKIVFYHLQPALVIKELKLSKQQTIEKIVLPLNWQRWIKERVFEFDTILITGANLDIVQHKDSFELRGLPDKVLTWESLFSPSESVLLNHMVMKHSTIKWEGFDRAYELEDAKIIIENAKPAVSIMVQGDLIESHQNESIPPAELNFSLTVNKSNQKLGATYQGYLNLDNFSFARLQKYIHPEIVNEEALLHISGGRGNIEIWANGTFFNKNPLNELQVSFDVDNLELSGKYPAFSEQHVLEQEQPFSISSLEKNVDLISMHSSKPLTIERKKTFQEVSGQFGLKFHDEYLELYGKSIKVKPIHKVFYTNINPNPISFYAKIPNDKGRIEILANEVQLEDVIPVISELTLIDMSLTLKEWLQHTKPHGKLSYIDYSSNWPIPEDMVFPVSQKITDLWLKNSLNIKIATSFSKVSLQAIVDSPGINNLEGEWYYDGAASKAWLFSKSIFLNIPEIFTHEIRLSELQGTFNYIKEGEFERFSSSNFMVKEGEGELLGEGTVQFQNGLQPNIDCEFRAYHFGLLNLMSFLPQRKMDKDLSEWLAQSIKAGYLEQGLLEWRGLLRDFPYPKPNGVFQVLAKIEEATFHYLPKWPDVTQLDTTLAVDDDSLHLKNSKGKIGGGDIVFLDANIPNLEASSKDLEISTKIEGDFDKAQRFVNQSPLKETVGKATAPFQISGPLSLSLGMDIPLQEKNQRPMEFEGVLKTKHATIQMPQKLSITNVSGELYFTQDQLISHQLQGKLFNADTQFTLASQFKTKVPSVKLTAKGELGVEVLSQWFQMQLNEYASGRTKYEAKFILDSSKEKTDAQLSIESDLKGIEVNAPAPFAKPAQNTMPFNLAFTFKDKDQMHLAVKYGQDVNLTYQWILEKDFWKPKSGSLQFGDNLGKEAKPPTALDVGGELQTFDFALWRDFIGKMNRGQQRSSLSLKNWPILPNINVRIKEFKLYDWMFNDVGLMLSLDEAKKHWLLGIDGSTIKGQLKIPLDFNKENKIEANIAYLNIKETEEKKTSALKAQAKFDTYTPFVDVYCVKCVFGSRSFEHISLKLEPIPIGYKILEFNARAPATTLRSTGEWRLGANQSLQIKGDVRTTNIYETLRSAGINTTLRNAPGNIVFDIGWNKHLMDIDLASLNGYAVLNLGGGVVKGADPGLGRILGLLNLDTIRRRLQLDFSDVAHSGLIFDSLKGRFQFKQGLMTTQDLEMNGPSARIEFYGEANLANQKIDGVMTVKPNVTGSLPIAAAIAAGNPAVGAAVWMMDKVLGRTIQDITQYQYRVSGTFTNPRADEISQAGKNRR